MIMFNAKLIYYMMMAEIAKNVCNSIWESN